MPSRLILSLLVALALGTALPAHAHNACCTHVHTGGTPDNNSCSVAADCSADWGGSCMEQSLGNPPFYIYCSCLLPRAYGLALLNALPALGGVVPAADTTVVYQTSTGPSSFGALLFGETPVSEWAPSAAGPGGILTLSYGVIEDPTAVPVSVDDLTLEFPPGMIDGAASGAITASLPPGSNPLLSYNSVTGELDMGGLASADVLLSNDVHSDVPVRLLWSGQVDGTSGALTLSLQGTSETLPLPVPGGAAWQWLVLACLLGVSVVAFRRA